VKVVTAIPTYNEVDNIAEMVAALLALPFPDLCGGREHRHSLVVVALSPVLVGKPGVYSRYPWHSSPGRHGGL
jgi:hypothetical protein